MSAMRKGFAWNLGLNLVMKVVTPVVGLLLARRLSPAEFGMYGIVQATYAFADSFRDSGVTQLFLRDPEATGESESSYARLAVVMGSILAAGIAATAAAVAFGQNLTLAAGLVFAAIAMLGNGFSTVPYAKLLKAGDFRRGGISETIATSISQIYGLGMVIAGFGFVGLASQLVVRAGLFFFLTFRSAPCRFDGSARQVWRQGGRSSGALGITSVLWTGFSTGDQALIPATLGLGAGGIYTSGKMLVQTADVIQKPLMQTALVAFSQRVSDPQEVSRILYRSLSRFLLVVAPVYIAVAIFAGPIVRLLLPTPYHATAEVLPPLCAYFAAIYPGSFAASALLMVDRPQIAMRNWIALYIALPALLAIFWGRWELPTLAWLLAGGLIAVNASTLRAAAMHFPAKGEDKRWLARGALGTASIAVAAAAIASTPLSEPNRLAVAAIALPLLLIGIVGWATTANPLSVLSVSGLRQVWRNI